MQTHEVSISIGYT